MSSTNFKPWGHWAAGLAGVMYIGQAVIGLVQPQAEIFTSLSDYLIEAAFIAALLFTLLGLIALHHHQARRAGRWELAGFAAASMGTGLMLLSASATLVVGYNTLGLFFLLGLVASFGGLILCGLTIIQTKTLPRWSGVVLMLGLPASVILADYGGGLLMGLAWVGLGYALRSREPEPMWSGLPIRQG